MTTHKKPEFVVTGEVTGLCIKLLDTPTKFGQKYLATLWLGDLLFSVPSFSPKFQMKMRGKWAPLSRGDQVRLHYITLHDGYNALVHGKCEILFDG